MLVSPRVPKTIDVGTLVDAGRVTAYQYRLVGLVAIAIVFDGIDNQLLGIALPTLIAEWQTSRSAFAPIVSLGYVGMMIGGAAAGLVGDRLGRRHALLLSLAVFGATTLATAAARDLSTLGALRLLAGIGLGGALPSAATLAAEFVPRAARPMAVTATIVCVPLGGMLAGMLGSRLLPEFGWRALFVVGGGLPLLAAVAIVRMLPESPRYLARHPARWPELVRFVTRLGHVVPPDAAFEDAGEQAVQRAPLSSLVGRPFRRDTAALWLAFTSCLCAVYLGFSWLPTVLAEAGFDAAVASSGITAFNLGGVIGALASGAIMSRIGSRAAMLAMTAGAVAGAAALGRTELVPAALAPIMILLTLTGGLINAVQTTMYALATNVYPSAIRATGVGAAVSVGRLGAILSGYAGPWALAFGGSASYFWLIAAAMTTCFVALAIIARHIARSHPPAGPPA